MTRNRVIVGIIMTIVTLGCIIASSFAWFSASNNYVEGNNASMTAKDPSILTVSNEVYSIKDMGNYKGQTGFAFYRYTENADDPNCKYILDSSGNKLTKDFTVYSFDAEQRDIITLEGSGEQTNIATYSIKFDRTSPPTSTSSFTKGEPLRLRVTNHKTDEFNYQDNSYNSFEILKVDSDTVMYDDTTATISIHESALTSELTVKVNANGTDYYFEFANSTPLTEFTYYINNTDSTKTVYNRLENIYSVLDSEGAVLYTPVNGDRITFDSSTKTTTVDRRIRSASDTCKIVYRDQDNNLTMESKRYKMVKYETGEAVYYKIFDKTASMACLYDGSAESGVTINVTEGTVTTYAVDDGKNMEDSAYNVGIQYELVLKTAGTTEYYLQFTPATIGVVPVHEAAKQKLQGIEGCTTGDVYYTYVNTESGVLIKFGLDNVVNYINSTMKTTAVTNYEGDSTTTTSRTMHKLSGSSTYGKICYETTKGYPLFYLPDGTTDYLPLTTDVVPDTTNIPDTVHLFVEIRGEKKPYDSVVFGDIQYSLKTSANYSIYARQDYSKLDVMDEDNKIKPEFSNSEVFLYTQDGAEMCAVYKEITDRSVLATAVTDSSDTLYASLVSSVYKDNKEDKTYDSNVVATKRVIYFLPASVFYKDFNLEVGIINHTSMSEEDFATAKANLHYYKVDDVGRVLNDDGSLMTFSNNGEMTLYCVSRIYYLDPYTFYNLLSDEELTYNYDYSLATPMYTVQSTGSLRPFEFSDFAFIGSHFLIRLHVASGEK